LRRAGVADGLLAVEALIWLAAARLLVLAVPFRLLARSLAGRRPGSTEVAATEAEKVRKIGWALDAVGRRVPWRCKCLERAIAGKIMLRLRGRPSTLFLGVARAEPGGAILAHAWLRAGDLPVVGEEAPTEAYAVVARFSPPPRRSRRA
jgi:hypothetical protein